MTAESGFPDLDYRGAANLMAHPVAGFAAVSAIGFGVAGHMMGLVAGTMAGAMEASRRSTGTSSDISDAMSVFLDWTKTPETRARSAESISDEQVIAQAPADFVASQEPDVAKHAAVPEAEQPPAMQRPEEIDDLKRISGIGPKLEQVLHRLGIWTFGQIAGWTPSQINWVDDYLQFKGRIDRDGWIAQARAMNEMKDGVS